MPFRAFAAAGFLVVIGGSVATGKHPSMFVSDLVSSPTDLIAADPNKSIVKPPAAPAHLKGEALARQHFRFYDRFTRQRVAEGGLADSCGQIVRRASNRAYVVDLAESSVPVRGEHWKGAYTGGAGVVTVNVAPGQDQKLVYLRATKPIIWNVQGAPSAIYLYGKSWLGNAPANVPVFSQRHASNCPTAAGLPRDVARKLEQDREAITFGGMMLGAPPSQASGPEAAFAQIDRAAKLGSEFNKAAAEIDRMLVRKTSGAPIQKLIVKSRGKRIDF